MTEVTECKLYRDCMKNITITDHPESGEINLSVDVRLRKTTGERREILERLSVDEIKSIFSIQVVENILSYCGITDEDIFKIRAYDARVERSQNGMFIRNDA